MHLIERNSQGSIDNSNIIILPFGLFVGTEKLSLCTCYWYSQTGDDSISR